MEPLKKASKVTLYDDVMKQIQQLIQQGQLKPGDRLLPERHLAEQLGVSRNTLRESLKALNLMGVLETRQGGGNYVSEDMNTQLISSSLKFVSARGLQDVLHLFETRRVLEAATASLAAANATPELVVCLEENLDLLRKYITDPELSAKYDSEFHLAIAEASGNPFLCELTKAIRGPLMRVMVKTTAIEKLQPYTIIYHERLLESMQNKDPDAAEKYMREHLLKVENEVRKYRMFDIDI